MIKKIVKDVKKILRLEHSAVAMEGQASVWEIGKTLRTKGHRWKNKCGTP